MHPNVHAANKIVKSALGLLVTARVGMREEGMWDKGQEYGLPETYRYHRRGVTDILIRSRHPLFFLFSSFLPFFPHATTCLSLFVVPCLASFLCLVWPS